jgi:hypothetical protein
MIAFGAVCEASPLCRPRSRTLPGKLGTVGIHCVRRSAFRLLGSLAPD